MKKRQTVAHIAGGCVALFSCIPLMATGDIYETELWWIAVSGLSVAAVLIVAAFWKD